MTNHRPGAAIAASHAALAVCALLSASSLASESLVRHDAAWTTVATAVVLLVAAFVSSIAGFAFSAIAGSALAYLDTDPIQAVQTMVLCSIATQLYGVWKIRESIRWRDLSTLLVAGTLTVPLGVWLLAHVEAAAYATGLACFVTLYGCYLMMRREAWVVRGHGWIDAASGALGGIAGGLAGLPGPFVTIWCSLRGWDKVRQRAMYQPYILVMQLVTLVCLRWHAPADLALARDLRYVPFALVGALGGLAVFERMTNKQFQAAVSVLVVVSGIGLLARAW
jgi:uncharacterized membrane protein YfcA